MASTPLARWPHWLRRYVRQQPTRSEGGFGRLFGFRAGLQVEPVNASQPRSLSSPMEIWLVSGVLHPPSPLWSFAMSLFHFIFIFCLPRRPPLQAPSIHQAGPTLRPTTPSHVPYNVRFLHATGILSKLGQFFPGGFSIHFYEIVTSGRR